MSLKDQTEHLKLCREVYGQLSRKRATQHEVSSEAISLPFNLSMLLAQFERYIRWADTNSNVVEIGVCRPTLRVSGSSDSALTQHGRDLPTCTSEQARVTPMLWRQWPTVYGMSPNVEATYDYSSYPANDSPLSRRR